jgi:tetratricopeptide (TPR) repeat protein
MDGGLSMNTREAIEALLVTNAVSENEKAVLNKFLSTKTGPLFLPAAEILRNHGCLEEAISLLQVGLAMFPRYVSAHVSLAKILYCTSRFKMARDATTNALRVDPKNLMALKLSLRLAVLFHDEIELKTSLQRLGELLPDDEFTRKARSAHTSNNADELRNLLLTEQKSADTFGLQSLAHRVLQPISQHESQPVSTTLAQTLNEKTSEKSRSIGKLQELLKRLEDVS